MIAAKPESNEASQWYEYKPLNGGSSTTQQKMKNGITKSEISTLAFYK